MKKFIKIFISLLFLILFLSNINIYSQKLQSNLMIETLRGNVLIQLPKSNTWESAKKGMFLPTGTKIKTEGVNSIAILKWSEGNISILSPFTNFTVDKKQIFSKKSNIIAVGGGVKLCDIVPWLCEQTPSDGLSICDINPWLCNMSTKPNIPPVCNLNPSICEILGKINGIHSTVINVNDTTFSDDKTLALKQACLKFD